MSAEYDCNVCRDFAGNLGGEPSESEPWHPDCYVHQYRWDQPRCEKDLAGIRPGIDPFVRCVLEREATTSRHHTIRCLLQLKYGRLSDAVSDFETTSSQLSRALSDGKGEVAQQISDALDIPHEDLWSLVPYVRFPGKWWFHIDRLLCLRGVS